MIVEDFQKFVENNRASFTDDEIGLFRDSVRCFHAGIFRPAYIMAYQSMMIYFRRLIQNEDMPAGFDAVKWKKMQVNLAKDKEWEEEVKCAIFLFFPYSILVEDICRGWKSNVAKRIQGCL